MRIDYLVFHVMLPKIKSKGAYVRNLERGGDIEVYSRVNDLKLACPLLGGRDGQPSK